MHNKFLKGIASVLSAALVLGSVFTGAVPAKAATASVKGDNGYETTYTPNELGDPEFMNNGTATPKDTAVTMTFTSTWGEHVFYSIPEEVMAAGFIGYRCAFGEGNTDGIALGLRAADNSGIMIADGPAENLEVGKHTIGKGTTRFESTTSESDLPNIKKISFALSGSDPVTIDLLSVTFITENAVGGNAEPDTGNDTSATTNTKTYTMAQLASDNLYGETAPENCTINADGTATITFSSRWTVTFFDIPQAVLDAGILGAKVDFESNPNIGLKAMGIKDGSPRNILVAEGQNEITMVDEEIITSIYGTPEAQLHTRYESYGNGANDGDPRDKSELPSIVSIGIVQTGTEGATVTVKGITFITEKAVAETTTPDPGTTTPDPGTENPSTETPATDNEKTYAITELTQDAPWGSEAPVTTDDGFLSITYTAQWAPVVFEIPEEVLNAGLVGARFDFAEEVSSLHIYLMGGPGDSYGILRKYNSTEIRIGEAEYDKKVWDQDEVSTEADLPNIKIVKLQYSGEESPYTIVIKSITFITEKSLGGTTDPGTTDPGTTDPGTTDPGTTDPGTTTDPEPTVVKPGKVTLSSVKATKGKVTVKWVAEADATKYVVYRSTSKTGGFKKVASTKKTTYKDKTVKAGTKYYYKVKAVNTSSGTSVSGKASKVKGVKAK